MMGITKDELIKRFQEAFGESTFKPSYSSYDVGSWTKHDLSREQNRVLLDVHRIVTDNIRRTQGYRDPDGSEMIMIIRFVGDVDSGITYQLDMKILDRVISEGKYTESDKSKLNAYRSMFKRMLNGEIWNYRWT